MDAARFSVDAARFSMDVARFSMDVARSSMDGERLSMDVKPRRGPRERAAGPCGRLKTRGGGPV